MNIFTNDDYRRIQAWLKANAIKDSDFAISEDTVPDEDILVITQNMSTVPTNYKIKIKDLLNSSLGKVVINKITANIVKVNNSLTVDASKVILNNEKGTTLQDVFNYFEGGKLNRHTDDTFDGNLTVKKNITIEGNIKSHDGTTTVEADLEATGEITDGQGNMLSDVNDASKGWKIEYQDPQQDEPTVRAKYVLKDYRGVPKGNVIKIYNDIIETNRLADKAVTTPKLSSNIQALISNLSKNALFAGIAIPTTNPDTPEGPVFYFATQTGTYSNFNGIEVTKNEVVILYYDTTWHKITTGIASQEKLIELNEKVNSLALGKFYGYFPNSSSLPIDITISGYAYIGLDKPYKIWNFNGKSWSDSGTSIDMNDTDEEDITRNIDGKLQFKDKEYGDGMGHVILRKNKSFAEQVIKKNTIYEIKYDFDLNGEEITIPNNCVLDFNGGSIVNGHLKGKLFYQGSLNIHDITLDSSPIEYKTLPIKITTPLYGDFLSARTYKSKHNINITDIDTIVYPIDRGTTIEHISSHQTNTLKLGTFISTRLVGNPHNNYINNVYISNYNIGIESYKNGYLQILNSIFENCTLGISIGHTNNNWSGATNIKNCRFYRVKKGLSILGHSGSFFLENCCFEGVPICIENEGSITIKNSYFGDTNIFSDYDGNINIVKALPGSTTIIENCTLGTTTIGDNKVNLFELQGTDENPCTIIVRNSSLTLGNSYLLHSNLYKSNSSKNKLIFENVTASTSANYQHNGVLFCDEIKHGCLSTINSNIINYVIDGYFKNEKAINLLGASIVNDVENMYGGHVIRFGIHGIYIPYEVPSSLVGVPMSLEVFIEKNINPYPFYVSYTASDCVETGVSEQLDNSGHHICRITFTPNKEKGYINFFLNEESSTKKAFIELGYVKLVENKFINLIDCSKEIEYSTYISKQSTSTISNILSVGDRLLDTVQSVVKYKTDIGLQPIYDKVTTNIRFLNKAQSAHYYLIIGPKISSCVYKGMVSVCNALNSTKYVSFFINYDISYTDEIDIINIDSNSNNPTICTLQYDGKTCYAIKFYVQSYNSIVTISTFANYRGYDAIQMPLASASEVSEIKIKVKMGGTTSERPIYHSSDIPRYYFDTTLNKPIWWTGTKWVDATGADV